MLVAHLQQRDNSLLLSFGIDSHGYRVVGEVVLDCHDELDLRGAITTDGSGTCHGYHVQGRVVPNAVVRE